MRPLDPVRKGSRPSPNHAQAHPQGARRYGRWRPVAPEEVPGVRRRPPLSPGDGAIRETVPPARSKSARLHAGGAGGGRGDHRRGERAGPARHGPLAVPPAPQGLCAHRGGSPRERPRRGPAQREHPRRLLPGGRRRQSPARRPGQCRAHPGTGRRAPRRGRAELRDRRRRDDRDLRARQRHRLRRHSGPGPGTQRSRGGRLRERDHLHGCRGPPGDMDPLPPGGYAASLRCRVCDRSGRERRRRRLSLYLSDGNRDLAVVLTPLGGSRAHAWDTANAAWTR
jgi:hypothetical protein